LKVTGVVAVDLRSNIAAEARAKIVYERLIPYFNGSTGESQYGEIDFRRPRNESHGLTLVESEAKGDEGLDVTPYDPEPGTGKNSPVDSTPVGAYTGGAGKQMQDRNNAGKAWAARDAEPAA
jgi:Mn-containing catalase